MSEDFNKQMQDIRSYYSEKIRLHGPQPRGVDWKDETSQIIRFNVLTSILPKGLAFTLNDLGCGYGALVQYLTVQQYKGFKYTGYDLSEDMINQAKQVNPDIKDSFLCITDNSEIKSAEYSIGSGLFNVRLENDDRVWTDFIQTSIRTFWATSSRCLALNFLSSYSDKTHQRPDLYYANPLNLYDFAMNLTQRKASIISDYDLFEFTLVLRR